MAATLLVLSAFASLAPSLTAAQATLAWEANPEPTIGGYHLYYGVVSGVYSERVDVGKNTTVTVPDLADDITYFFVVTAYDTLGFESLASNEVSTFTGPIDPPPAPPGSLVATAGDGVINLDWSDNTESDLASYRVFRSVTTGSGFQSITSGLTASGYVDSNVNNGTTYYYVVAARDTAGNESAKSNESAATPVDMLAPIVNLTTESPTVYGNFDVALDFSEAVGGLELTDFVVDGGYASALAGGAAGYTTTISPTAPGTVTVALPAGAVSDAGGNGNLASNPLSVTYWDPDGNPVTRLASSESTQTGNVYGSLADLGESDNSYQVLREASSVGNLGERFSQLQHTWTFEISGSNPVLHVEAFHSISADGDDFVFSYSVDGVNFTDAITVTRTADNDQVQTASMGSVSGTVMIRVDDSNHSAGSDTYFDTLWVDALFIETSNGGGVTNTFPSFDSDPVTEVEAILGQAYTASLADNASDADGDVLTFEKLDGPDWMTVGSDGSLSGIPADGDLGENLFTVAVADGRGGVRSAALKVGVVPVGGMLQMSVANLTMASDSARGNRHRAVATVEVVDQTGAAVAGAIVEVEWSGSIVESGFGVTDATGTAVIESSFVKRGGTFVVTVSDIQAEGFTYNPALDEESSDTIASP